MRHRIRTALFLLGGLTAVVALASCQRSPGYKRDQGYYKPEPTSYYGAKEKSPSQRVESLGQPKKRVVVLNFWNDTPVKSGELGLFAADELRRGLHLTQRMIVPADLRVDVSTEDFIQGEKVRVAQLIREGRRLGISVLVIGRVTRVVFRQKGDDVGLFRQKQSIAAVDLELKLFDVAGGREIMASARSGEASSNAMVALEQSQIESPQYRADLTKLAVRIAAAQLVPDVVKAIEKLGWQGRIAKVAANKIYVNAGKASGLMVGDILRVLAPGDDVYDPGTGAFLGRSQGQMKGTLEVVDFLGTDGAVAELHTGGNVLEGDLVQLY
ncbi:MAG: CsgG/HfaB family protein [Oligoflexia bacterium]|nr:CsgG/HfaB family protein [Oligoflexia bacterium]